MDGWIDGERQRGRGREGVNDPREKKRRARGNKTEKTNTKSMVKTKKQDNHPGRDDANNKKEEQKKQKQKQRERMARMKMEHTTGAR